MKEYDRLKKKELDENQIKHDIETTQKINKFLSAENNIVSKPIDGFKSGTYK